MVPKYRLPIFVISAFFFFLFAVSAQAVTGDYNKAISGTLAASEWNNLVNDFVDKSGDRLNGFFSINTATSSTYALDINGALRATSITGALSGTLNAANISTGLFGSNTGGGNYNFPANIGIGIGTSTPGSSITLGNNRWISALNNAGTGYVNMFKVNANDEIEIGGPLNIGQFQFAADSGFNTFVDMPVTSASPAGSVMGYTMKVDGDNILNVYSQSDGLGGISNRRVGINTSSPGYTLDVAGIINATALYVNGMPYIGSQWLTQGTSVYYNSGNVGIGTSTPVSLLDVNGLIKMRSALITANEDVINKGYLDSALASTTAQIITQVSTSSFWQGSMAGNVYNANTGNVGIGTTAPVSKLTVFGANPRLSVSHNVLNAGDTGIDFILNPTMTVERKNAIIVSAAGSYGRGNMSFVLDSALDSNNYDIAADTKMTILNNGNVGIGTTNPGGKVSISGGEGSYVAPNFGSTNLGAINILNTTSDRRNAITFSSAGSSNAQAGIYVHQDNAAGTHMYLATTDSYATGPQARVTIKNNGNIGIGATNPNGKLSVNGAVGIGLIASTSPVDNMLDIASDKGSRSGGAIRARYISGGGLLNTEFGALTFKNGQWVATYSKQGSAGAALYTDGEVNMMNGNVGIGVTNPTQKLNVSGGVLLSGASLSAPLILSDGNYIYGGGSTAAANVIFGVTSNRTELYARSNQLGIYGNSGSTNYLYINAGNIGIGTTTPAARLSISGGNAFINDAAITSGTPKAAITKEYLDSSLAAFASTNNTWLLNGSNLYASSTTWNVGIGTTTPVAKLDINGNMIVNGANRSLQISNNGYAHIYFQNSNNSIKFDANQFQFNTTQTNGFTFSGGNVGIGTTTPGTRLTVVGSGNYSIDAGNYRIGNVAAPVSALDAVNKSYMDSAIATATSSITLWGGTVGGNVWNLNSGNVGIGTTNPTGTFHVSNASSSNALVVASNGKTGFGMLPDVNFRTSFSGGFWAAGESKAISVSASYAPAGYSLARLGYTGSSPYYGNLTLMANGTTNVYFDANSGANSYINAGNVGIGTTAPGSPLSVQGTSNIIFSLYNPDAGQGMDFVLSDESLEVGYVGRSGSYGVGAGQALIKYGSTDSEWGRILYTTNDGLDILGKHGNVGIGTTTTTARLSISGGNTFINDATITSGTPKAAITKEYLDSSLSAFASTNNAWLLNGSNLYASSTSWNIGIGTTAPTSPLTVSASSTGIIGRFSQSAAWTGSNYALYVDDGDYSYLSGFRIETPGGLRSLFAPGGQAIGFATAGDSAITFTQSTSVERMRIAAGGNVGIGATTPTARLSISGGNAFINDAAITSGTPKAAITKEYLDSSLSAFASTNNTWVLNGSNLFASSTAWNVGIGTTTPTAKLEISAPNSINPLTLNVASGGTDSNRALNFNVGGTTYGKILVPGGADAALAFWTGGGASNVERMRISMTGNVGIGTTTPSSKLHIKDGGATYVARFEGSAASVVVVGGAGLAGQSNTQYLNSLGQVWVGIDNTGLGGISATSGATGLALSTVGSERIRINNSGSIGIGTTTPAARLSISGGNTFIHDAAITSGTPKAAITKEYLDSSLSAFASTNNTWVLNGSNLYASSTSWNVGIGTTVPGGKLHVAGLDSTAPLVISKPGSQGSGTVFTGIEFKYAGGTAKISRIIASEIAGGGGGIEFQTPTTGNADDYTTKMMVTRLGNVGIGTTNPGQKLDVAGSTAVRGGGYLFTINPGGSGPRLQLGDDGGSATAYFEIGAYNTTNNFDSKSRALRLFNTNGSINLETSGNVGIGTTTPTARLSLSGGNAFINDAAITSGTPKAAITKEYLDSSLSAFASTNNTWILNGSNLYASSTAWNVGIGTTNPGVYRLNVNGDTNITGSLNVTGTTTATAFVGPVVGTLNAANVSAGAFGANTGGGNYSFASNLGIGTTNPGASLEIGTASSTGNYVKVVGSNSDNTYDVFRGERKYPRFTLKDTIAGGAEFNFWNLGGQMRFGTNTGGVDTAGFVVNSGARPIVFMSGNLALGPYGNDGLTAPRNVSISVNRPYSTYPVSAGSLTLQAAGATPTATDNNGGVLSLLSGISTGSGSSYITFNTATAGSSGATDNNPTEKMRILGNGNVGIGTTDPGLYRLKVAGDVAITGTLQTQTGSDFAEEFSVEADIAPGMVVVMSDMGHKSVRLSTKAYDRTVVGIVSDNPSIIAGRVDSDKKAIVAMMGVVSVNVSGSNGSIKKGDLLTSAGLSGYAMKATEFIPGTVIGKALEDMNSKTGRIKVLVNLQ